MRKSQQKNILALLKTLKTAHQSINKAIAERETDILEQCQGSAIAIGESIEESEGNGLESVSLLEEYCELIYKESNAETENEWSKINKSILKLLNKIEESIDRISITYEIVFLPYHAAMWDSMESIWLAAKEDSSCQCYVVPIPYYDKNKDGSFGTMYYAGNDFPDYVPVTNWEKYNLEAHQPDVIYIHNPYDGGNFVTSVHPFFYSKNLKKFTDKLVYIPYFVIQDIKYDIDNIKNIEHFCFLPGVYYADKVIVQSENVRQAYLQEYCRQMEEIGLSTEKKKLLNKISGMGSPKFDTRMLAEKMEFDIPKEWRQLLQPDIISEKPVILYNTTIAGMLHFGDKMLDKLIYVINIFKENQDKALLWWRPHPLLNQTIRSMKSELWDKYQKIVEQYEDEHWGIFDETSNLERAIALSDAYYGDMSSVAELFAKSNKPVVYQDVEYEYVNKVFFYDMVLTEDAFWAPMVNTNAFCKGNLVTGKIEKEVAVCTKNKDPKLLYSGICLYEHYLILSPRYADTSIVLYDINTEFSRELAVEGAIKEELNFQGKYVYEYEKKLYIFSFCPVVLIVDTNTWNVRRMDYPETVIEIKEHGDICRVADRLYIPFKKSSIVFQFHLATEQFTSINIPGEIKGIDTLCFDGKNFWITGIMRGLYRCDAFFQSFEYFAGYPDGFSRNDGLKEGSGNDFITSFPYKNYICLIPRLGTMFLKINTENAAVEVIEIKGEEEDKESLSRKGRFTIAKYQAVSHCGDKLYFLSSKKKVLYELNLANNDVREIILIRTEKSTNISEAASEGIMTGESQIRGGLTALINGVLKQDRKSLIHEVGNIGIRIHRMIMDEVRQV